MKLNVHAGHNPQNKVASGAVGLIYESTEARNVVAELIRILKYYGHTVYDCTCNNGASSSDVLSKIVNNCNQHNVDLGVSIHFNSCVQDYTGDGKTTGVEVLTYSEASASNKYATQTVNAISTLGYTNRGVKYRPDLYILRETTEPTMLVECCFVDDKDDVDLYNAQTMALAIAKGIDSSITNLPNEGGDDVEKTIFEFEFEGEMQKVESILDKGFNFPNLREFCNAIDVILEYDPITNKTIISK